MKMPGFTAEKSLYETKGHYRAAPGVTPTARQILPQAGVVVYAAVCCKVDKNGIKRCWTCTDDTVTEFV